MSKARAGWTEIDITPPLGLPIGGRGSRFTPGAYVLDPLIAQALVLEDGAGRRLLWISMDMIGMSYHATLEPKPEGMRAYETGLTLKTVRMVCEAIDRLAPAEVSVHWGRSHIGINRRRRDEAGKMGMGPDPDGKYNPDLWVLDVEASDGRCLLFSYGCHPVLVYGYAYDSISADWPGACRNRLKDELGPDVQAQFIQGLAGNVRPRQVADLERGIFRKPTTAEDPIAAGGELANDVIAALNEGGEVLELDLAATAGFALVPRDLENIQPLAHWQELAASDDELSHNIGAYWTERLQSGLPPDAGEPLAEWLGHFRAWLEDEHLVAWGYCQDGRCYVPTDEVIPEGGYEVGPSNLTNKSGPGPFAAGINAVARRAFLSLQQEIS
jgi:hypothetical protein